MAGWQEARRWEWTHAIEWRILDIARIDVCECTCPMAPQNLSTSDIHVCVCLFSGGPSCVDQTTEAISASLEISEIHVRSGALIDKIEIHYRDGTSIARGTNGGGPRPPFVLQEGEKLVKIQTRQ